MSEPLFDIDATAALRITLSDLAATEALAERIAPLLRPSDIVALGGDLGAGKTAFSRALIRTIGGSNIEVPSPTFTLVQTYELPAFELWHFDLYRLDAPQDAMELDIEEAFASCVSLIEWPERLGPYLPANRLDLRFAFGDLPSTRFATLKGGGDWTVRLESGS